MLIIGLGIENDLDWHITLTFANGKFTSVDDNELKDETENYLKISLNGR